MFDYKEALVDYLAEPENLSTALEVSDHIEKVKDKLQYAFWMALQLDLEARLVESGLESDWELVPATLPPVADYYGCGFSQIGRRYATKHCLRVQMEQSLRVTGNRLSYGVCWNQKTDGDLGVAEIPPMKIKLALAGFRFAAPWYLGIKSLDYCARHNEFLIAVSERGNDLVLSIAQPFWTFFEEMRDSVMQIDSVLAS